MITKKIMCSDGHKRSGFDKESFGPNLSLLVHVLQKKIIITKSND